MYKVIQKSDNQKILAGGFSFYFYQVLMENVCVVHSINSNVGRQMVVFYMLPGTNVNKSI